MPGESELAGERGRERAHRRKDGRAAEAGMNLLGHGHSPGDRTPFDDERREPRLREANGRDEPVVPGADDDDAIAHDLTPGLRPPPLRNTERGTGGEVRSTRLISRPPGSSSPRFVRARP